MTKYTLALAGSLLLLTAAFAVAAPAPPAAPAQPATFVGRDAPAFTLPGTDGKPVDVGAAFGTRPVVLIFYRGIWCPFCKAQMTQLGRDKDAFLQSGATVYAISDEDAPAQVKMQKDHDLEWVTFLSDKQGTAARQYAGVYDGRTTLKPGVFVVDLTKKITYAYVNEDYKVRAGDADILAAVRAAAPKDSK